MATLSGGQQQMVAIAKALVSHWRFLLIDEMSLGLAPVIMERLIDVIHSLRSESMDMLLIEQCTQFALNVADYCNVMSQRGIKFNGLLERLESDSAILERAYPGAWDFRAVIKIPVRPLVR